MGDVGFAGTAFSSLGNQSDKPRVRAEPDEPQAPLAFFVYAEKFSHGLPALNHHAVGIVHDAVANRISHNLRADFANPAPAIPRACTKAIRRGSAARAFCTAQ